jgi:hypothetical protein
MTSLVLTKLVFLFQNHHPALWVLLGQAIGRGQPHNTATHNGNIGLRHV